jgi:hypothetical protein
MDWLREVGEGLEGLWASTRNATSAVGEFVRSAYGEEPYSAWVKQNPQAALREGGQPREWRDQSAEGFQPSLMQQEAWPEMLESSFVNPSRAVLEAAKVVAKRVMQEGGDVSRALWKGLKLVKGPHGEPIEYFSDRGAKVMLDQLGENARPLEEVVEHGEAFQRVAALRKTQVQLGDRNAYDSLNDIITLEKRAPELMEKSLWHEWEHAIARKTGLPGGTSPSKESRGIWEEAAQLGETLTPQEFRWKSELAYWDHPGERLARMNAEMTTSKDELVELMRPAFRQSARRK